MLSGLPPTWKSQRIYLKSLGICDRISNFTEFCCLKFIFSQVQDPNFEIFCGEPCPQIHLDGLGLTVELNLSPEKPESFILSGKWQPCALLIRSYRSKRLKYYGKCYFLRLYQVLHNSDQKFFQT